VLDVDLSSGEHLITVSAADDLPAFDMLQVRRV